MDSNMNKMITKVRGTDRFQGPKFCVINKINNVQLCSLFQTLILSTVEI